MRTHAQTAGVSLTAQQPLNNIARTAIEALAGVLGGTQSLHTNSYDEALALPTEDAVRIALRTQQMIAHETGVANTIDPLGGAYFVEALTDEIEARALRVLRQDRRARRDGRGGQAQLSRSARSPTPASRSRPRSTRTTGSSSASTPITEGDDGELQILRIDPRSSASRSTACRRVRARRDGAAVEPRSATLKAAAAHDRPQPDAEPDRVRARTRHRGRDRRSPPGGLRHLHRDTRLLVVHSEVPSVRKLLVLSCSSPRAA